MKRARAVVRFNSPCVPSSPAQGALIIASWYSDEACVRKPPLLYLEIPIGTNDRCKDGVAATLRLC
jgi:hypothetical protein